MGGWSFVSVSMPDLPFREFNCLLEVMLRRLSSVVCEAATCADWRPVQLFFVSELTIIMFISVGKHSEWSRGFSLGAMTLGADKREIHALCGKCSEPPVVTA